MKSVTWNVQGLRFPQKRMKVLRHLKRLWADVALLQELHFREADFPRMKRLWVGEVVGSQSEGRRTGVLIVLHKRLTYKIKVVTKDDERGGCRYACKLTLQILE